MRPWIPLILFLAAPGAAQAAGTFTLTSSAFADGGTLGKTHLNAMERCGSGGDCPPPGEPPHHYVITVWAVGEDKLPFDAGSKDEEVGAWLAGHALGKATITARYGR